MFFIAGFTAYCQVKASVVIIITQTFPYCGGANSTNDLEKKDLKKKLPATETFYIIKGKINTPERKVIKRFSMRADGRSFISLNSGTYSIINKFLFQKLNINKSEFDEKCLKQFWATPLFTFTVNNNKTGKFVFNIEQPCEYNKPCAKLNVDIPM